MNPRDFSKMPTVGAVMTPFPHYVVADDPVEKVERLMEEHGIRHVPVQEGGRVVGIISERDLHRLVNPALPRVSKTRIRARDIVSADPFVVDLHAPLGPVVAEMANRQVDSVIVVKNAKLAGILSETDVCRVLAQLLASVFPTPGGDDAA